jgi:hypothetical protein|tara:strand:+ start:48 stop:800 length:753 start_codon:yes stop_codon:yes gene_type:complete
MKKSQLRKIIRENIKSIMSEQTGGWPNYMNWTVGINNILFGPPMHNNPCNFLEKRYNALLAKLNALGGGTGVPNSPAGIQHAIMLTLKLQFLAAWIAGACGAGLTACCSISTPITEQRGGGLAPIPAWALALVAPGETAKLEMEAKKSVQRYMSLVGQDTSSALQEQANFNLPAWQVSQATILNGNPWQGTPPHPNPCNYLNRSIARQSAKLAALGGGTGVPNTAQGQAHAAMLTQKIAYWQAESTSRGC